VVVVGLAVRAVRASVTRPVEESFPIGGGGGGGSIEVGQGGAIPVPPLNAPPIPTTAIAAISAVPQNQRRPRGGNPPPPGGQTGRRPVGLLPAPFVELVGVVVGPDVSEAAAAEGAEGVLQGRLEFGGVDGQFAGGRGGRHE